MFNLFYSFIKVAKEKMSGQFVEYHLSKVYELLFITLVSYVAGGIVNYYLQSLVLGMIGFVSPFIIIFIIYGMAVHDRNTYRYLCMMPLGFALGLTLFPLLIHANIHNKLIIHVAGLSTCVLFGLFTLVSKFVKNQFNQSMGIILVGCLAPLCVFSLMNIFFRFGSTVEYIYLALSLAVFSLLVAHDTSKMYERFLNNDVDYVVCTLDLFLDIVNIFVNIVRILTKLMKKTNT
jgi:FtsH-binding integral membrane protein